MGNKINLQNLSTNQMAETEEAPKKNMCFTYTMMLGMLVFGSANTLLQNA